MDVLKGATGRAILGYLFFPHSSGLWEVPVGASMTSSGILLDHITSTDLGGRQVSSLDFGASNSRFGDASQRDSGRLDVGPPIGDEKVRF